MAKYNLKTIISAIPGTGGIKTAIANKLGCERNMVNYWIEKYPQVKKAYEQECESALDFAESKLMQNIKMGNTQEILFLLKTRGKSRGYVEKQEIDHSGSFLHKVAAMTDEEIKRLEDALNHGSSQ